MAMNIGYAFVVEITLIVRQCDECLFIYATQRDVTVGCPSCAEEKLKRLGQRTTEHEREIDLVKPIDWLHLPSSARAVLKRVSANTVADLITYTEKDLMKLKGFGKISLGDLNCKLGAMGLSLREED